LNHEVEMLEHLVILAKEHGATTAKIIDAKDIVTDRRVRLKCSVPLCSNYGRHLMCPPNLMDIEEFEKILALYDRALLIQIEADVDSSDKCTDTLDADISERLDIETGAIDCELKLHQLINLLETAAFKSGFYLAAGLIGGECCLCEECVSPHSEEGCRHPFQSRPSMEAMGIDVYETCRKNGLPIDFSSKENVRWTGLILLN